VELSAASVVRNSYTVRQADPIWSQKLPAAVADIRHGTVVGVNSAVLEPMPSGPCMREPVQAALDAYNLTFATDRVVVDTAALMTVAPAGTAYISPLLREIMVRPCQLAEFVRVALDAYFAGSAILRVHASSDRTSCSRN
jgi:hypothetical protein